MAKTKIGGNKHAEAWIAETPMGMDMIMHGRVMPTHLGKLFGALIEGTAPAALSGDRRMSPPELVDYCKRVTMLAYAELADNPVLGIKIPGLQTILDRLRMAAEDDAMDDALDRAMRSIRAESEDDDDNLMNKETKGNG